MSKDGKKAKDVEGLPPEFGKALAGGSPEALHNFNRPLTAAESAAVALAFQRLLANSRELLWGCRRFAVRAEQLQQVIKLIEARAVRLIDEARGDGREDAPNGP